MVILIIFTQISVNILSVNTFYRRWVIVVTISIELFIHDALTTGSTEETFRLSEAEDPERLINIVLVLHA